MPSLSWFTESYRSEEHTSELQSLTNLVCRLLLEKKEQAAQRRNQEYQRLRQHRAVFAHCHAQFTRAVIPAFNGAHDRLFIFLSLRAPPRFCPFPPRGAYPF